MNYPAPPIAKVEMPTEAFVAFLREAPNDMPAYSALSCQTRKPPTFMLFCRRYRDANRLKTFRF